MINGQMSNKANWTSGANAMHEIFELVDRLEKLERQNRRTRRIAIAGVLCAGVVFLVGAQGNKPEVLEEVRAKRFVVIDDEGRERTVMHATADRSNFAMSDENGKERVSLFTTKDYMALAFVNSRGKVTLSLMYHERHNTGLVLVNRHGTVKSFELSDK